MLCILAAQKVYGNIAFSQEKGNQRSVGENDSLLFIGIFAMLISGTAKGGLYGSQNCYR